MSEQCDAPLAAAQIRCDSFGLQNSGLENRASKAGIDGVLFKRPQRHPRLISTVF